MTNNTTNATPAAPIDQRPTCCECGSHNVETMVWATTRADGAMVIVDGDSPHGDAINNWCHDCQEHTDLEYQQTTPADNARRREAEAAREAAPELLAAFRWAIDQIDDDLDPDHQAALSAARELLDRLA